MVLSTTGIESTDFPSFMIVVQCPLECLEILASYMHALVIWDGPLRSCVAIFSDTWVLEWSRWRFFAGWLNGRVTRKSFVHYWSCMEPSARHTELPKHGPLPNESYANPPKIPLQNSDKFPSRRSSPHIVEWCQTGFLGFYSTFPSSKFYKFNVSDILAWGIRYLFICSPQPLLFPIFEAWKNMEILDLSITRRLQ